MKTNIVKKLNIVFLCLAFIVTSFSFTASALQYPVFAQVSSNAKIYSKAGTTGHEVDKTQPSQYITTLSKGTIVKLVASEKDGDGDTWYKMRYGDGYSKEGYIYSSRVTLMSSYETDKEFEKWLDDQGFPESYKPGLRDLHSLYPNWVFYADHTELDWQESVDAESEVGIKLVSKNADNSWKSMEYSAYNWETNTWNILDSGGWVAASKSVVAYYMDPRNFFDTSSIFMFLQQSYNAESDTLESVQAKVKGTFLEKNLPDNTEKSYAQVLLTAGKSSGVSPLVIASIIIQEQGSDGSGTSISGTVEDYKGIYNFFNVGAAKKGTMSAVERGLWWAAGAGTGETSYNRPWNTREKSITGGAVWYGESYVNAGQDTFYYKDFNVKKGASYKPYTHQYATAVHDAYSEGKSLSEAFIDTSIPLAFHIPVYTDMPESTVLPQSGTSNNNLLSSLSVKGYEMNAFDKYNLSYELIVGSNVSSVTIQAVASDSSATVSGVGKVTLKSGDNIIPVTVTSTSGEKRTYKVSIYREPGGESVPTPVIKGACTINNGYISGSTMGIKVDAYKKWLNVQDGTVKLLDSKGIEKESGTVATGDKVLIYDNDNKQTAAYTVVIYGEVSGDGKISAGDLALVKMHRLNVKSLTGVYLKAADVNRDGKISAADLALIKMHRLNIKTIQQ